MCGVVTFGETVAWGGVGERRRTVMLWQEIFQMMPTPLTVIAITQAQIYQGTATRFSIPNRRVTRTRRGILGPTSEVRDCSSESCGWLPPQSSFPALALRKAPV